MILPNRMQQPSAVRLIGLLCLAVAIVWINFAHGSTHFDRDWTHLLVGILLGVSIVMNFWSVRLTARRRGCRAN
jgi:hypothetical protein